MLDINYLNLISHSIQLLLLFYSYLATKTYFGNYFSHN